MEGDERIRQRIAARKHAEAVLQLGEDDPPAGTAPEFWIAYWQHIAAQADLALARFGVKKEPPRPRLVPMNDQEAKAFQERPFPPQFKKHAGEPVWRVAEHDQEYLDYLAESVEAGFVPDLRRWMARAKE